ncbi:MAG: DUF559 domain-containing protein [Acidimicrobiia bacterium]|nr:DUF559 domain-containing protein [Acidimicrobiia bacterium]
MTAEIDRRVEELASRQLGHFSVRQVLLLQGTRRMVAHRRSTGRWQSAGDGVLRLLGSPETFEASVMAAVLGARCTACASHRCAARLHGQPGFGEVIEITALAGSHIRRVGVLQHRSNLLPAHHVQLISGIPVTTLARTLFDLSAVIRAERLARAIDTALGRGSLTLVDPSRVARDMGTRGRRRATVIRSILEARGDGFVAPASVLEQEFVDLITAGELPQPDRQVDLGDDDGWIGRVDFLYRDSRIVIETDGKEHHTALLDRMADADRDRRLTAAGWRVLRFAWFDIVHRPEWTLDRLRAAMRSPA